MRKSSGPAAHKAPVAITDPNMAADIARRCSLIKNKFFPKEQPAAIVILDIETTGLSAEEDWPTELAALFISGCNGQYDVVHAFHSYLNWTGTGLADPVVFRDRLNKTNAAMLERDPTLKRFTAEELEALGKHPVEVLGGFAQLVTDFFQRNSPTFTPVICGHNALFFDTNFLHTHYAKQQLISPLIGNIFDTGLVVKAAQISDPRAELRFNTPLIEWLTAVRGIRARVKWSLHDFCYPTFGLHQYIPDFVFENKHTALTDCWTVYGLLRMCDLYLEGR